MKTTLQKLRRKLVFAQINDRKQKEGSIHKQTSQRNVKILKELINEELKS